MDYRFGDHLLDTASFTLTKDGEKISVEPQVFSLLVFLVENCDRVVGKNEIFEHVWDGRIVSDGTLNSRINSIRRALGDDGKAQAFIKTFPRRGFRFVAALNDEVGPEQSHDANRVFDKPSIAVLPFGNLSGDLEQEYFSDGITEDIITALSHIRQLLVIARNTTFTFKGQAVNVQAVARDLGVQYVLEGSVRRDRDRVRISAQLIDGETGNHVWAERYDREMKDVFTIQDEITELVVGSVAPELDRAERERVLKMAPESLDSWELYQKGLWHIYRFTREDTAKSLGLFEQAVRANPRFGPAHAGVSFAHFNNVFLNHTEDRDGEITETYEAAQRALECDKKDAAAHWVLARALVLKRENGPAISEFEAAIELNPSYAHGYYMLAWALMLSGQATAALRNIERAMRLSPHDPLAFAMMGVRSIALIQLGEMDEAAAWIERAMRQPNIHALLFANAALCGALAGRELWPNLVFEHLS
ncbi:MAG: winged helix-turn-helix domain-containing protein, partial [Rhodospirillales bacterium]|nr:winged helix-turn-helix domain-containing protein [Rhodospirillales bacterium]